MTSSPDLIEELRAARPAAPADLRARVRTIAAEPSARTKRIRFGFPVRRGLLVAVPAAAALALASAGVLGLTRSGGGSSPAVTAQAAEKTSSGSAPPAPLAAREPARGALDSTAPQSTGRAQQVSASLKQKWAKLTDDDLKLLEGKKDEFVGRLQQKYGMMKDEAEKQLDEVLGKIGKGPHSSPPMR